MSNPTSVINFTDDMAGFLARENQFGETNQSLVQQKKNKSPGDGTSSPGFPATESTSKSVAQWPNMVDDFTLTFFDWTGGGSTSVGSAGSTQKFTFGISVGEEVTIGDGTSSPALVLNRAPGDTGGILFLGGGPPEWSFTHTTAGDMIFAKAGGVAVLTLFQASNQAAWASDVILDSASPTITVGDGTDAPSLVLDGAGGSSRNIKWGEAGVTQFQFGADPFDRLIFTRLGGALLMAMRQSDGRIDVENSMMVKADLEIDGALNHDGSTAGFYNTAPITKPSITTADAASIITALAALGLVSDDT